MKNALDGLLDRLVLPGFSRVGFFLRRLSTEDLPRAEGRKIVISGATSGLGRAAAVMLAELGAVVIAIGRDHAKLASLRGAARDVVTYRADLSSVVDTYRVASEIAADHPVIDVLINNVGGLWPERKTTKEGLELTFVTNLLGQFILTRTLAGPLGASERGRLITVSSGGMYTTRLDLEQLTNPDPYRGPSAYAQTKRAQVVLAEMWAERLADTGVVSHSMHPGWAATPGLDQGLPTFSRMLRPLLRTAEQGADTMVFLATHPAAIATSGLFWHDRRPRRTYRSKRTVEDEVDRVRLWALLEAKADRRAFPW